MKFRSTLSLDVPMSSQDCGNTEIRQAVSDLSSDPAKHAETDEMIKLVQQAFTTLTEDQRTVVILREYHALKFPEIAEIMKCPVGTVKSLNYRGHQKLLKILSGHID